MMADGRWRIADGWAGGRPPRDPIRHPPSAIRHSRAFTLIELILGLALSAIVLLGISSAIVLAARAVPDDKTDASIQQSLDAAAALARITDDARFALHFSELTATAITFAVPDRDDDGDPERIRYHWSGTAGAPLYRSYNGGANVILLDAVQSLSFTTSSETVTSSYPGPDVKSSEVAFAGNTSTTNSGSRTIESDKWIAQVIRPNLAADATRWQVSRAYFALMAEGLQFGTARASIRSVTGSSEPTSTMLDSVTLKELDMSTTNFYWHEFVFNNAPIMQRGQKLAFVLDQSGGTGTAGQTLHSNLGPGGIGYHVTSNSGGSWSYNNSRTLMNFVVGYYWTPGPTRTLTRTRLTRLTVTVQPTTVAASRAQSACPLVNRPWHNVDYWHLTFDEADPTDTDSNADGTADWIVRSGGSFNRSTLNNGKWAGVTYLDSRPQSDFPNPTTIDLRIQATVSGSDGPAVWINLDWSGSTNSGVYAVARLESNGTQTIKLYTERPGDDLLTSVTGLPAGMIDLRLMLDPGNNEVALFVNGVHRGTFNYQFESDAYDTRCVALYPAGSGALFDEITVISGGSY
ncbi:MAG: prepilin-type N-terminal cleavage/methylation domain-containing protein [Phycisphaeraceae bacterium]|nr:prepilin-type N-terminal cleavage/methylation domain-containing protein [Phycisphaeraceae bacterium]